MFELLWSLLQDNGVHVDAGQKEQLLAYHRLLMDWNQRMDLTNVLEEDMPVRHYADSLLPLANTTWFGEHASLIDVGTGAGFPGLPIAIARQDMRVTLLDALQKRCTFLQAVVEELRLTNVQVLHARAEDAARTHLRAQFDLAVARAVAPVQVLAEYLLPFVQVGGFALCWKGPGIQEEMAQARKALKVLGGKPGECLAQPLPGPQYCVQAIKKQALTPAQYPRKAGTPTKNPL